VERPAAGALQPGRVLDILSALQQFFVVLDRDDDGNGFALARHDLGLGRTCFHAASLRGLLGEVNSAVAASLCRRTSKDRQANCLAFSARAPGLDFWALGFIFGVWTRIRLPIFGSAHNERIREVGVTHQTSAQARSPHVDRHKPLPPKPLQQALPALPCLPPPSSRLSLRARRPSESLLDLSTHQEEAIKPTTGTATPSSQTATAAGAPSTWVSTWTAVGAFICLDLDLDCRRLHPPSPRPLAGQGHHQALRANNAASPIG